MCQVSPGISLLAEAKTYADKGVCIFFDGSQTHYLRVSGLRAMLVVVDKYFSFKRRLLEYS